MRQVCDVCKQLASKLTYKMPNIKKGICERCSINPKPSSPVLKFIGSGWTPKEYS